MKVEIVKPYGYCVGVERAIKMAKKIKEDNKDKNVVVLGMLVHNNDALNELSSYGVNTLYKDNVPYIELINELKEDDIVILTAHGHDKRIEDRLNERNIKYFDATCPFVEVAHKMIIEEIEDNHEVIYIGKKNHPESVAALSISDKVHLYDIKDGIDYNPIKDSSPLIINQTTFSKEEIINHEQEIIRNIKDARIANTVCNASSMRQKALLSLSKDVDIIYVIGGPKSNNTKTLFELAKSYFKNSKVLIIENKEDINKKDLLGLKYAALVSGASTPIYITDEIKEYLESLD